MDFVAARTPAHALGQFLKRVFLSDLNDRIVSRAGLLVLARDDFDVAILAFAGIVAVVVLIIVAVAGLVVGASFDVDIVIFVVIVVGVVVFVSLVTDGVVLIRCVVACLNGVFRISFRLFGRTLGFARRLIDLAARIGRVVLLMIGGIRVFNALVLGGVVRIRSRRGRRRQFLGQNIIAVMCALGHRLRLLRRIVLIRLLRAFFGELRVAWNVGLVLLARNVRGARAAPTPATACEPFGMRVDLSFFTSFGSSFLVQ